MKTESITVYRAFDGKHFEDAAACRAYEAEHLAERLVGLTSEQIFAAQSRSDAELAEAFEQFGNQIAQRRRDAGELKRHRRPNGAQPQAET